MRKLLSHFSLVAIMLVMLGLFSVPYQAHAVGAFIQQQVTGTPQQGLNEQNENNAKLISCGLTNIAECALDFFYGLLGKILWWVMVPATGWLLWLVGQVIDFAVAFTFTTDPKTSLFNAPAIGAAWSIIRDICNMVFIFVLIYTGISTILNIGNAAKIKTVIGNVVIAALLLNFSLFITKSIIDVSNISTAWFVQGIKNIGGGTGISDSVAKTLQMQKLAVNKDVGGRSDSFTLQSFVSGLALVAVNCVAIFVFFQVAFFLIARIVAFMFLLITAPIGFLKWLGIGQLSKLGGDWWEELRKQALMAPMFFLMLYITLFIVDQVDTLIFDASVGVVKDRISGADFGPANYLMFAIIIAMLMKSLSTAKEYSGEIGNAVGGYLKSASSIALGAASGGVALLGRTGAAAAFAKKGERLAAAGTTLRSATPILNSTTPLSATIKKTMKEGSWDFRNSGVPGVKDFDKEGKKLTGLVGVDMTAKSAKDIKEDKEKKEKEFKLEASSNEILKQIRDIEGHKATIATLNSTINNPESTPEQIGTARNLVTDTEGKITQIEARIKDQAKKISNKDLESIIEDVHSQAKELTNSNTNPAKGRTVDQVMEIFTDNLKQNQVNAILNGEAAGPLKNSIRSARQAELKSAIQSNNPTDIKNALYKLSNEEISKMDISDLSHPDVIEHLKVGHLQKIADEYTYGQRTTIRNYILGKVPNANGQEDPVKKWLESPAGSSF